MTTINNKNIYANKEDLKKNSDVNNEWINCESNQCFYSKRTEFKWLAVLLQKENARTRAFFFQFQRPFFPSFTQFCPVSWFPYRFCLSAAMTSSFMWDTFSICVSLLLTWHTTVIAGSISFKFGSFLGNISDLISSILMY